MRGTQAKLIGHVYIYGKELIILLFIILVFFCFSVDMCFIFTWNVFFFFFFSLTKSQIRFCIFFKPPFFIASLPHPPLIPLSLPSAYSPTSWCGVLICTLGICCFVIGSHKSFLLCITSLLDQTAMSFQEGIFLLVCVCVCVCVCMCVVPSCLPHGAWLVLCFVCVCV